MVVPTHGQSTASLLTPCGVPAEPRRPDPGHQPSPLCRLRIRQRAHHVSQAGVGVDPVSCSSRTCGAGAWAQQPAAHRRDGDVCATIPEGAPSLAVQRGLVGAPTLDGASVMTLAARRSPTEALSRADGGAGGVMTPRSAQRRHARSAAARTLRGHGARHLRLQPGGVRWFPLHRGSRAHRRWPRKLRRSRRQRSSPPSSAPDTSGCSTTWCEWSGRTA